MTKAIGQARTDSNQISFSNVKVSPDRLTAIVPSSTNDGSTTRVTFAKVCESYDACKFMCMARTGTPCKHIVRACDVAKIDVKTLLHPSQKIQNWIDLHARTFKIPTMGDLAQFKHLRDENLCVAPMTKRPRGRPKMNSENVFAKKKKRNVTCSLCGGIGRNHL